jgi:hypothetical protein
MDQGAEFPYLARQFLDLPNLFGHHHCVFLLHRREHLSH